MTENKNAKTPTDDGQPVAWISHIPTKKVNGKQLHWTKEQAYKWSSDITPLYSAPKKQWVGLTDEEIHDLIYVSQKIDASNSPWFDCLGFYRAVEDKLKERNT